ncbi:ABC transporter permease [Yersinia enterocolitica]|uniref:ABC transporter permease n=1 Tax=Yersinia enterocolitica TaxID=630 RepID=UPI002AC5C481|nr:ABC transporter permease [Yersinia enterocolitica]HEN3319179.1 ABC transporter permease [Yersinia enterocolitica]
MSDIPRYGPTLLQLLIESLDSLRLLGRRALLALLGIAVGCAAVVALINIGHNAEVQAMSVFKGMGSDLLVANIELPPTAKPLSYQSSALNESLLRKALPEIQSVSALTVASSEVRTHGRSVNLMVAGVNAQLAQVLDLQIAQGRFLSRYDDQNTYVVLGANVVAEMAANDIQIFPGAQLQLEGYLYQVIGILHPWGTNPMIPISIDDSILIPIAGMHRVTPSSLPTILLARTRGGDDQQHIASELQQYLAALLPDRDIAIHIPQQLLAGMAQQSRMFAGLLAGLGGISLLVGGVGVMNVMLMNVSQRKREIGVRMSLGARASDIANLFLFESITLTLAGAAIGALCGTGAAWLFVYFSRWAAFSLSPLSLPLGIVSSVLTGLFFGIYPALTASRLQPAKALRDE